MRLIDSKTAEYWDLSDPTDLRALLDARLQGDGPMLYLYAADAVRFVMAAPLIDGHADEFHLYLHDRPGLAAQQCTRACSRDEVLHAFDAFLRATPQWSAQYQWKHSYAAHPRAAHILGGIFAAVFATGAGGFALQFFPLHGLVDLALLTLLAGAILAAAFIFPRARPGLLPRRTLSGAPAPPRPEDST